MMYNSVADNTGLSSFV